MDRWYFKSPILVSVMIFLVISDAQAGPCGAFPYGNCFQECFGNCNKKIATENDQNKREQIVMEKHVCEAKCQGELYTPKKAPKIETDFDLCTSSCGKPTPDHCTKGYLSMFYYCDCLDCCTDGGVKYDPQLCSDGCHEYFGKLGYPTPNMKPKDADICKYRPEYNETTNAWCLAWCTWKTESIKEGSVAHIQSALAPPCVARCSAFITSGVPISFRTKLDNSCTTDHEPWRCVTSVSISRFAITSAITDDQIKKAPTVNQDIVTKGYTGSENNKKNHKIEFKDGEYKFYKFIFSFTFPPWIEAIKQGGKITVVTTHAKVETPSGASSRFPWDKISNSLKQSAGNDIKGDKFDQVSAKYRREFEINGCTRIANLIAAKMAKVDFDIEFYVHVSDSKGLIPLTAGELKNATRDKWKDAEYVKDVGAHMIELKGKGKATAEIAIAYHTTMTCASHCSGDKTWDAKTACKCTVDCDDEPIS